MFNFRRYDVFSFSKDSKRPNYGKPGINRLLYKNMSGWTDKSAMADATVISQNECIKGRK
jgi:hypothetical protein